MRDGGALAVLPLAFSAVIVAQIYAGELAAAAALIDEVTIATEATGSRLAPYGALILAAWRGRESDLVPLVDATLAEVVPRGEGIGVTTCHWVTALLRNGLGQYEEALAAARLVIEPPRRLDWPLNVTLPEFIEAAVRSGHPRPAREALERLVEITRPGQTDWGLGIEARCRALLSEPADAEPLYQEAIERLGRTRVRGEHARAHLLYGEWLRREGRRVDARTQLRIAYDEFLGMGIEAFAERARRELLATGETVRKRAGRISRRADAAGVADRVPRARRAVEPGHRRTALPQPPHRRMAPQEGVHQTRDQITHGAARCPPVPRPGRDSDAVVSTIAAWALTTSSQPAARARTRACTGAIAARAQDRLLALQPGSSRHSCG